MLNVSHPFFYSSLTTKKLRYSYLLFIDEADNVKYFGQALTLEKMEPGSAWRTTALSHVWD